MKSKCLYLVMLTVVLAASAVSWGQKPKGSAPAAAVKVETQEGSDGIEWLRDKKVEFPYVSAAAKASEHGSKQNEDAKEQAAKPDAVYVSPLSWAMEQSARDGRPVILYFTYDT